MTQPLVPPFGKSVNLRDFDPTFTGKYTKERAEEEIEPLRTRLNELQDMLYADRRYALLVVLQAIDTGGKDGTVKSVFREVGPLGCSVESFGVPTEEEASHDYLWRYHCKAPARGKLVIFNRSYYESVLVERVRELVPKAVWEHRYHDINAFESYLSSQRTAIVKFFLHISKDEQRHRLQERIDNPRKRWKFRSGDLEERTHWHDYQEAFQEMLSRCNSETAPWHIIPANHKWYRDVVVARTLIEQLEQLGLRYPDPAPSIPGTKVK